MKFVVFLAFAAGAVAQPVSPRMDEVGSANLPAQKVGPHDLLAISVYRSPELSRTLRTDESGAITLPLLGQPVPVAGFYPHEVELAVAKALREGGILVNPVVKVTVAEYASRPVRVAGAVKKPVTFQAFGGLRLLDALARADGLAPEAGAEIIVTRAGNDQPQRIPVRALIDRADPALNLALQGGEEIRVPEAGRVFVAGNVRKPGSFTIRDRSDASVMKMVALAEGLMPFAAKQAFITRTSFDGTASEIAVELEKIMERKAPDVPLEANDVLYIPDNKSKRRAMTVVDRVTSFGASTASGVLIWRR
jgi:polysaccharide export outer membrane protein